MSWEDKRRISLRQKTCLIETATQTEDLIPNTPPDSDKELEEQDIEVDQVHDQGHDHGGIICDGRRLSELSEDESTSSFGDHGSTAGSDSSVFLRSPKPGMKDKLIMAERVITFCYHTLNNTYQELLQKGLKPK